MFLGGKEGGKRGGKKEGNGGVMIHTCWTSFVKINGYRYFIGTKEMPTLDLLEDWKNRSPYIRQIIFLKITALMTFPKDKLLQAQWVASQVALYVWHSSNTTKNIIKSSSGRKKFQSQRLKFSHNWNYDHLNMVGGVIGLLAAPSFSDLVAMTIANQKNGIFVGNFLYVMRAIYNGQNDAQLDDRISINKMAYIIEKYLKENEINTNQTKIKKLWSEYKTVAHLWASDAVRSKIKRIKIEKQPKPQLEHKGMKTFLSIGEDFRHFGEHFYPRSKAQPLFSTDELWRVPQGFKLPPVPFRYPPPRKSWVAHFLKGYMAPVNITP